MGRITSLQDREKSEVLDSHHIIGRSRTCRTSLSDKSVSAMHACLRWEGQHWTVTDLQSRNGTYVDGRRIEPNLRTTLAEGARVAFGSLEVAWCLDDASPPVAMVVPVGPGSAVAAVQDCIYLEDSSGAPQAMITQRDGAWSLEQGDTSRSVEHGDTFTVGDQEWRFYSPEETAPTTTLDSYVLSSFVASFLVSRDEEEVALSLVSADKVLELGTHSFFYLLLTLARRRLEDQQAGRGDPQEHGWTHREELCSMLKCDDVYKNVHIFRIRKRLADAGVLDAAKVIERKAQQIRIGVGAIEIRRR